MMRMKCTMDHKFNWPLDKIAPLLANEELVDFEDLPNVSKRKFIDRRREGTKIYKVCEWNVHGQIPKAAQRIIRPEMLTFTEHTVWDDNDCSFESRIEPHFLKNIVKCTTRSKWSEAGAGLTHRHIEMLIEVRIPVLGQLVESTIIDHMKKNTEKSTEVLKKAFENRIGPKTA